ncbi:hypothetical protein [Candidatus Poriferisodalis sp.]|uniref:hypothetical protein n=1 Tax=Candidatus Poriferisodalis sp. TaxID=3101277 RepID=UPI003B02BC48
MGFVDDLWAVLLSGDEAEEQEALDRLVEDDVTADIAFAALSAGGAATYRQESRTSPPEADSDRRQQ